MNIDFGRHSEDYAAYRPGLPASFYQRLDAITPIGRARSLDLATGPGTIALELAERGCSVVGIDISEEQIAMAGSNGMHPERIDELVRGGFRLVEAFCYDRDEEFSHARWRGRMRTCNGVGSGGLPPPEVQRFDDALRNLLCDKYPDPMIVEHRVWCVVAGAQK